MLTTESIVGSSERRGRGKPFNAVNVDTGDGDDDFAVGVEVSPSMIHGGPFSATSDGRMSSGGTFAAHRFLRAVSYQDYPWSYFLKRSLSPLTNVEKYRGSINIRQMTSD